MVLTREINIGTGIGSGVLWRALACIGVLWRALACTGVLWRALACSGVHWHALACIGVHWRALACTGTHWHALACPGVLWRALACSALLWRALACSARRNQRLDNRTQFPDKRTQITWIILKNSSAVMCVFLKLFVHELLYKFIDSIDLKWCIEHWFTLPVIKKWF